jgi:hypothetical protein
MASGKSKEERMRKLLGIIPALSSVFLCALLIPATSAQATPHVPELQSGKVCVNVSSQNNWQGTICAIVNEDDMLYDEFAQALITFSIRSGDIYEVYIGGGLYLRRCPTPSGSCSNQNYVQSPSKFPGNVQSTFISNNFGYDVYFNVQARANTPCIIWTNGQEACYNGDLRSDFEVPAGP